MKTWGIRKEPIGFVVLFAPKTKAEVKKQWVERHLTVSSTAKKEEELGVQANDRKKGSVAYECNIKR